MDLSQQELPLTAYFSRGGKEAKTRTVNYQKKKNGTPAKDSQCSKPRKSDVCSTASPLDCSADQSGSRKACLQLPTPATSTRKRKRNEHPEALAETRTSAASTVVAHDAILLDEEDIEFGPTPSRLPQVSRKAAVPQLACVPLLTPSTGRRRTTKSTRTRTQLHHDSRRSGHGETSVNHSPLTRSKRIPLVSPRVLDTGIPRTLLPCVQDSAHSTTNHARPSVKLDHPDPFHTREKDGGAVQRDIGFAQLEHSAQLKVSDDQLSDGYASPVTPVPSSQSQYLLHPDATPKRRRYSRHIDTVISSQTQEERELTLSTPHRLTAVIDLPVGASPGKYSRGSARIPRLSGSGRKSRHVYALGSTPVKSRINSLASPSRSFAVKKTLDVLSLNSSSPSRRPKHYSPSRKAETPRRSRHKSVENIPPAHIEDSVTESETESDILHMKMKAGLLPTLSLLSHIPRSVPDGPDAYLPEHRRLVRRSRRNSDENITPAHVEDSLTESETESDILHMKMKAGILSTLSPPSQVLRPLPDAAGAYPPDHRRLVEDNLPAIEDDSVTEAESDAEILRCAAEIGKNRFHCSQLAKEDIQPPPVISPIVSPARSRASTVPLVTGSSQFCTQEGAGLSISESRVSYPSVMERPQILSESLPSVVHDFLRMFPGDESYPADFPESLRV